MLVARSQAANPRLNPELTAYTPGETLRLLDHPEIAAWHRSMRRFELPDDCKTVVLVPCAKTKPWTAEHTRRSTLYRAYNQLRADAEAKTLHGVYFVTVSEPLGVVPESRWGDFPQYDNPGLFRDDAQRSGMFKNDWEESRFKRRLVVPFDPEAYETCIRRLGGVISDFVRRNAAGRRFVAFVDGHDGSHTTHGHMLDVAGESLDGIRVERFAKTPGPRTSPYEHIKAILAG